jgi:membrane protein implicated in regulation of membrane protease activity
VKKTEKAGNTKWHAITFLIVSLFIVCTAIFAWRHQSQQTTPSLSTRTYRVGEPAAAGKTILMLSGSGDSTSNAFSVRGDWSLYWDFLCDEDADKNGFRVDVQDSKGASSGLTPIAHDHLLSGYGTQPYVRGGDYRVSIASTCKWHIIVKS